jgi:membrane protease YdiL (CAAX protease family)
MTLKKDRLCLIAGLMPALAILLLMLAELLTGRGILPVTFPVYCGIQVTALGFPLALQYWLNRRCTEPVRDRILGRFSLGTLPFIFWFSGTVSLLSFALNLGVTWLFGLEGSAGAVAGAGMNGWQAVVAVALLPALMEELLFRGVLLSGWEQGGTWAALLVSAVTFAVLHGNPANMAGPLAAGFLYGYMAVALRSVWPAVLAHFFHNAHYLLMNHLMTEYATFGIWPYFVAIDLLLLCVFLYFSMASLGKLLEKGKIQRFTKAPLLRAVTSVLASPGLWLTALLATLRLLYA